MNREQWLTEASALILEDIIRPVVDVREDLDVRMSVGFPAGVKLRSKVIGVCHNMASSTSGTINEIFITPTLDCSETILSTLCHELLHAADDCESGHKGFFAKSARKIGLEGKLTATYAGEELLSTLQDYIEVLGPIPHASLRVGAAHKKPQKNRSHKVWCVDEGCGFKFNASLTQVAQVQDVNDDFIRCPCCGGGMTHEIEGLNTPELDPV